MCASIKLGQVGTGIVIVAVSLHKIRIRVVKGGRWSGKGVNFEWPYFCQYLSELYQIFSSCVLCGYRINFNILRYSVQIFSNCYLYSIGCNEYFGFLLKLLDTFLLHA